MGGKINVYTLGTGGVNVDKSPIHKDDSELLSAQNAYHDPNGVLGGLRKRDGIIQVNGSTLAGTVSGITALPIPFVRTRTIYAGINPGTSVLWRTSTNGTTWASNSSAPSRIRRSDFTEALGTITLTDERSTVTLRGKMYYAGDDYSYNVTQPTIRVWDGTFDGLVTRVPLSLSNTTAPNNKTARIVAMTLHNGSIYIATHEVTNGDGRVFKLDHINGTLTQVGLAAQPGVSHFIATGQPHCLASYNGYLWVGLSVGVAGRVYRIRPGIDTDWIDDSGVLTARVTSLAPYKGNLYAGHSTALAGTIAISKRTAATGTWALNDSFAGASTGDSVDTGLTVFGENLYSIWLDTSTAPNDQIAIRKYDDTSWSTVQEVVSAAGTRTQRLVGGYGFTPGDGAIYFVVAEVDTAATTNANEDGIILRSTDGTTWVEVDQFTNLRGTLAYTLDPLP
jgi:hypothetical protein